MLERATERGAAPGLPSLQFGADDGLREVECGGERASSSARAGRPVHVRCVQCQGRRSQHSNASAAARPRCSRSAATRPRGSAVGRGERARRAQPRGVAGRMAATVPAGRRLFSARALRMVPAHDVGKASGSKPALVNEGIFVSSVTVIVPSAPGCGWRARRRRGLPRPAKAQPGPIGPISSSRISRLRSDMLPRIISATSSVEPFMATASTRSRCRAAPAARRGARA